METKNKVATVRKEGVSDSGKPNEAINEAKGMDAVEILRNHLEVRNCFTALTSALDKAGINADVTLVIH